MTRERKSLLAGIGVLILTVLLVGTAALADQNNVPQSEWLMVMEAEQAEFVEATDGKYTLTLTDADPVTLAFTDRPERIAQNQKWDTTVVLDYWESEFNDDPPNAAVTADGVGVAVTLSEPCVGIGARNDGAITQRGRHHLHCHTLIGTSATRRHYQPANCLPGHRPNFSEQPSHPLVHRHGISSS